MAGLALTDQIGWEANDGIEQVEKTLKDKGSSLKTEDWGTGAGEREKKLYVS